MNIINYSRYFTPNDEVEILIEAIAENKHDSKILQEIVLNTSHAELCCYANDIKIPLKKKICILITSEKISVYEHKPKNNV